MYKVFHALLLTGVVTIPALATAADSPHSISGNIGITTDYVFRGVSQTQNKPALQGGFDYAHSSGFYVGAWASNQAWVKENGFKNDSSLELDLYAGYKGAVGDLGYDVGIITYYYPGDEVAGANDPDTTEAYLGLAWKTLSLKYNYAVSKYFIGWGTTLNQAGKTRGSWYLDLSGSLDLRNGWSLLGHVGYQEVKDNDPASYTDWKLGIAKDIGFGTLTLAYTDTDADTQPYTWAGEEVADGRVFLTFSKSF